MIKCKLCNNEEFIYMRGLSNHIKDFHNMTSQEYYDMFYKKDGEGICLVCKINPTNFHNLSLGYYKTCGRGCANNTESHKESVKTTKLLKYGSGSYNNPEKISETLNKRSQVEIDKSTQKAKETKLKRFGDETYNNQPKRISTMIKNGNALMSKSESRCYFDLCEKFGKDNIKIQYSSEEYPFFCDFYVSSLDLYIEINFSWLHGNHRFDSTNEDDVKVLDSLKIKSKSSGYYKKAIDVWTISDEEKYKIAETNRLNYAVFYNKVEFKNWLNSF